MDSTVKRYIVPITGELQASFVGHVEVYASSAGEAAAKVQDQVDQGTLDDHTEMIEETIGCAVSYGEVAFALDNGVEVIEDGIEVDEDEVDPAQVIAAEVKELQRTITWDAQKRLKHKAFLERLAKKQPAAA